MPTPSPEVRLRQIPDTGRVVNLWPGFSTAGMKMAGASARSAAACMPSYEQVQDVALFDASQLADLDKKLLPAVFMPLVDDREALFGRLVQVVEEVSISVDQSEHTGNAQGSSQGWRVTLKVGLDSPSKVLVLRHEYARELLHWSAQGMQQPVAVKERHAEVVSYVVARHFGIPDYLHTWGTTTNELFVELDVVWRAAAHIIERVQTDETEFAAEMAMPAVERVPAPAGEETALSRALPPKLRYTVYHTNVDGAGVIGSYDSFEEAKRIAGELQAHADERGNPWHHRCSVNDGSDWIYRTQTVKRVGSHSKLQ